MPASRAAPAPRAHPGNPWMFPVDGSRLRALRQERGLSRDVLAERAGISADHRGPARTGDTASIAGAGPWPGCRPHWTKTPALITPG